MAISKVIYNNQTLMDLTSDTVAAATLKQGETAHGADGEAVTGSLVVPISNFELIGTKVFENVAEYTDTSTSENMDTEININNTDYAWGYVVVTCDTPITTSNEWGMSIMFWGRYTSNNNLYSCGSAMQKGSATFSRAAMVTSTLGSASYGVGLNNNTSSVIITRKCHGTACPKIRAGNYTVKVYGMTAL